MPESRGKSSEKKVMLGHRLRRLRREQGMTQSQLAEQLEISPSYLNLIEHNQRPVSAVLLLRLARAFELDLQSFAEDDESRVLAELREVFADPALAAAGRVGAQDLRELAALAPPVTQAIVELYRALREARRDLETVAEPDPGSEGAAPARPDAFPLDRVHDVFQAHGNHFAELESAADALWQEARLDGADLYRGLVDHLQETHGLGVRVMPQDVMGRLLRRYDRHRRRILLSEVLPRSSRSFHLAAQLAAVHQRPLLDRLVAAAKLASEPAQRLLRMSLGNYFAGAVVMPYERFLASAQGLRYDIELLTRRFEASFEQVCHRLTTLQRPGARGVPFSLLRIDRASNISKRFSSGIPVARFGNACPLLMSSTPSAFPAPFAPSWRRCRTARPISASRATWCAGGSAIAKSRPSRSPSPSSAMPPTPRISSMPTGWHSIRRRRRRSVPPADCATDSTARIAPSRRSANASPSTRTPAPPLPLASCRATTESIRRSPMSRGCIAPRAVSP
jgi:XRE family transcriptional regulator, fatty acid utilization regulator